MATYRVVVVAISGERLTLFVKAAERSTPTEHAVCEIAHNRADLEHFQLAPWTVATSHCESA